MSSSDSSSSSNEDTSAERKRRLQSAFSEIDEFLSQLCKDEKKCLDACVSNTGGSVLTSYSKCQSIKDDLDTCHKKHMNAEKFNSYLAKHGVEINRPKSIFDLFSFSLDEFIKVKK